MEMQIPSHACAYLTFTKALHSWMLSTYGTRITTWLDLVWRKIRAHLIPAALETDQDAETDADAPITETPE